MTEAAPGAPGPEAFDPDLYLVMNPDVRPLIEAGEYADALDHWTRAGRAEQAADRRPTIADSRFYTPPRQGRPPSRAEMEAFDAERYLAGNPDLEWSAAASPAHALEHWVKHGRYEGSTVVGPDRFARRTVSVARLMRRPFGVNFYAPFSTQSGLGTAARGYLRALRARGVPVRPFNLDFDRRPVRITAADYDAVPPYRVTILQANADMVERVLALFRLEQFDDTYVIALWAWELGVLRPDWFQSFAAVDEVWTLSDANTAAVASIAPVPVHTVNCVVDPPAPPTLDRKALALPDGFIFLTAFDVGSSLDRKNPFAVLDAFNAAFAGRDDVFLVVKFHSSGSDPVAARALAARVRNRPNVIVRAEKLSTDGMQALQACSDCLVSAHRSEGFGLNIAEFMARGKPVIVTGFGGNMDFTTERNSFLVPYRLAPITRASGPYLPGYLWAEPDVDALAARMTQVEADRDGAARVAEQGARDVSRTLSAEAIGARMVDRFDALGLRLPPMPFIDLLGRTRTLAMPPPASVAPIGDPAAAQARPTISVIVPVYDVDAEWLIRCIESVRAQTYLRWELCLCDDASTRTETRDVLRRYQGIDPRIRINRLARNGGIAQASNAAVTMATGSFLLMLDNDDELTSDALHHIASAIAADPAIDVLYADEDKIDPAGRLCDHYFKPDWSPEHLESVMYTLHPLTVRTSLFLELGGFRAAFSGAQDYDLMLRLSRRTGAIHHVPRILYHWRMIPGSAAAEVDAKPDALAAGGRALADHVREKYGPDNARVEPGLLPGYHRVRHAVAPGLPVTVIITTNNGRIELPGRKPFVMVDNLVESILRHTRHPGLRIVVADNANSTPAQLAERRRNGVAVHSYGGPMKPFNYADKINFALRHLETEHVVMMNDDMEVMDADWLPALLEFSQNPEVGAVAGKFLHADGTIQHVGAVMGINNNVAHVYHGFPGDFVGYNGFTHVIRNFSVVTAACLATRRSVLQEVGGFDRRFAIDYNDTDLCLRMRQQQYRIVYTPFCRLYHFESATAVRTTQDPRETELFRQRWGDLLSRDPFYNPNLSEVRHDYSRR